MIMTAENSKAEEYLRKGICQGCTFICEANCAYAKPVKQAYLDGLAEGRKELEQWKQEWQDAQIKANEEGFARTTLQIKYSELEKEIKDLQTRCHIVPEHYLSEAIDRCNELEAQIEKMKVCGSCKYVILSAHEEPCIHCSNCFACKDKKENKWELAE